MHQYHWSPKISEIGHQITALTLAEAAQLRDHLRQVYGIEAQVAPSVQHDVRPDVVVDPRTAEPTAFDVVLQGIDPNRRIAAIKQVRESANVGLKEARELIDGAPKVVKERLNMEEAEQLRTILEASGAKAVIRPCAA